MKKIIFLAALINATTVMAADLVTFTANTPALASEVNQNFTELETRINNIQLITGPQGPQGIQGVQGIQGAQGDSVWNLLSNNIYYTAGSIGIGTSTPLGDLQVDGVNSSYFTRDSIGTIINPNYQGAGKFSLISTGTSASKTTTELRLQSGSDDSLNGITLQSTGVMGVNTTTPQSALQVNGYIQLSLTGGAVPATSDCDASSEYGRMIVDETKDLLYICTQSGWISK